MGGIIGVCESAAGPFRAKKLSLVLADGRAIYCHCASALLIHQGLRMMLKWAAAHGLQERIETGNALFSSPYFVFSPALLGVVPSLQQPSRRAIEVADL